MWWVKAIAFVKKWWFAFVGALSLFTWFASRRSADRDISKDEELAEALRREASERFKRREVEADAELEAERALPADDQRDRVMERVRRRRAEIERRSS